MFKNKKIIPTLVNVLALMVIGSVLIFYYIDTSKRDFSLDQTISLILDFIGTILISFFSFPSLIEPEGHNLVLESYDEREVKEAWNANFILGGIGLVILLTSIYRRANGLV